jgi:hypothetical protein
MSAISRRTFAKETLGSLLTISLLETLFECDAFADKIKPVAVNWLNEVNQLGLDLKAEKIPQPDWQKQVEMLFAKVTLPELVQLIDFDKLTQNLQLADNGVRSLRFNFREVEGVPTKLAYGKQIFAFKRDRSVVPHGHNNMATAFLILKGDFQGRHYDRLEDENDHLIIKPTINRKFSVGEYSTVTDFKDNIHWFKSISDEPAFIFNIHALNVNPGSQKRTGRVYVDPNGEKLKDGLVRARLINYSEAHKLYG